MITSVAVAKVISDRGITKYKLSQEMDCFPTSINQWLTGTKMCASNRLLFFVNYGIKIDDDSATE